jgi:hypothetical protein
MFSKGEKLANTLAFNFDLTSDMLKDWESPVISVFNTHRPCPWLHDGLELWVRNLSILVDVQYFMKLLSFFCRKVIEAKISDASMKILLTYKVVSAPS